MQHTIKYLAAIILIVTCCVKNNSSQQTRVIWKNNKAAEIWLWNSKLQELSPNSLEHSVTVRLDSMNEAMLGKFTKSDGYIIFEPVVPFSNGLHYNVFLNGVLVEEFEIEIDNTVEPPRLSIFPSSDTVPENILKMYFHFSQSMVEGKSLQYINILNEAEDTLNGVFLDMQPELWNEDGTILTLWFDPGRVKRDLIPNQKMGNPVLENHEYKIIVSGDWKSKAGLPTGSNTIKQFKVIGRDEVIPDVQSWTLAIPKGGSHDRLDINFLEPLDYSLTQSTIRIKRENDEYVSGSIELFPKETGLQFIPDKSWDKGVYVMEVESRLEDLAGNNLSRPFDRDIQKINESSIETIVERKFLIE